MYQADTVTGIMFCSLIRNTVRCRLSGAQGVVVEEDCKGQSVIEQSQLVVGRYELLVTATVQ